jgi:hypothetical protein
VDSGQESDPNANRMFVLLSEDDSSMLRTSGGKLDVIGVVGAENARIFGRSL